VDNKQVRRRWSMLEVLPWPGRLFVSERKAGAHIYIYSLSHRTIITEFALIDAEFTGLWGAYKLSTQNHAPIAKGKMCFYLRYLPTTSTFIIPTTRLGIGTLPQMAADLISSPKDPYAVLGPNRKNLVSFVGNGLCINVNVLVPRGLYLPGREPRRPHSFFLPVIKQYIPRWHQFPESPLTESMSFLAGATRRTALALRKPPQRAHLLMGQFTTLCIHLDISLHFFSLPKGTPSHHIFARIIYPNKTRHEEWLEPSLG